MEKETALAIRTRTGLLVGENCIPPHVPRLGVHFGATCTTGRSPWVITYGNAYRVHLYSAIPEYIVHLCGATNTYSNNRMHQLLQRT